MKLVSYRQTGQERYRTDVCGLEHGHGGPHKGKHKGIVWQPGPTANATPNIIQHGGNTIADEKG